jgi:hypothetical protein
MLIAHGAMYLDLRGDLFRLSVLIAGCALVKNFLPQTEKYQNRPRVHSTYCFIVALISFCGLSWRCRQPSLDLEFMGFKRRRRKEGCDCR